MIVKLDRVKRAEGNTPKDYELIGQTFKIITAMPGASARLLYVDSPEKIMKTSTVNEVGVHHWEFIIKTVNTEYSFEIIG